MVIIGHRSSKSTFGTNNEMYDMFYDVLLEVFGCGRGSEKMNE